MAQTPHTDAYLGRLREMPNRSARVNKYIDAATATRNHRNTDILADGWFDAFQALDATAQAAWDALTDDERAACRVAAEGI